MKQHVDFNGYPFSVEDFKKALTDYPSYAQKMMDDDGTPVLAGAVMSDDIEGNGTIQFPLRSKTAAERDRLKEENAELHLAYAQALQEIAILKEQNDG